MRVLHSPINIAGGPGAISQGLRELGVESTLLVFNERPFERGFDINIQQRYLSAVCPVHGRFHELWTGAAIAPRPDRISCPGDRTVACGQDCGVDYVYEPAGKS